MAGVFLVNVLDVARALGSEPAKATAELVGEWLLLESKEAGWRLQLQPCDKCDVRPLPRCIVP